MNGSIPGFTWLTGVGYFKVSCDQCGWEAHESESVDYGELKFRATRHSRQHELVHPEAMEIKPPQPELSYDLADALDKLAVQVTPTSKFPVVFADTAAMTALSIHALAHEHRTGKRAACFACGNPKTEYRYWELSLCESCLCDPRALFPKATWTYEQWCEALENLRKGNNHGGASV